VEPKLLGDVANLKALALQVRRVGSKWLPVDYYTVFSELEAQLANEFDFEAEAEVRDVMMRVDLDIALSTFVVEVCHILRTS